MTVQVLNKDEALRIHERVCKDFAETDDPVGMGGVRDQGRDLESALHRQHTGIGDTLKYPTAVGSAATLTFGLCCGHPFHNGNKRTALVCMLAHLDKNGMTLVGVKQRDLYRMIKEVATHSLGVRVPRRRKAQSYTKREADLEVAEIAKWLEENVRHLERGERVITYRQLRKILSRFGLTMENPRNNKIGIYQEKTKTVLLKKRTEKHRIATIGYPGDGRVVNLNTLKRLRRDCKLTTEDGCDASSFYEGTDVIDAFINEYRAILRKLARE
jgi:death-on-curing protein